MQNYSKISSSCGHNSAERHLMRIYTIIEDAGQITSVMAKSRAEAINKFLAETGMTREFFKKHCIVKAIR